MLEINRDIFVLQEKEIVSCKELFNLFWKRDQNILYITNGTERFVGIITIGSLLEQMRTDIDAPPYINTECLKILKDEFKNQEEVKKIFEEYHIATAIPVIDEDGKVCYEIRKSPEENKNVLVEFKEKIMRYQKSHYLRKEIICLQKILEEQDVVVIGNEEQFDFLLGDIFQNKKRVVFLDSCKNAYELMCENKSLFVDLQASDSRGREKIYNICNSGYTGTGFVRLLNNIIESEYCSKFYQILDNDLVTIKDFFGKYMTGAGYFSKRGIFTKKISDCFKENKVAIVETKGIYRTGTLQYDLRLNGTRVDGSWCDSELVTIGMVNLILQLYILNMNLSKNIQVLNFALDDKLELTDAEKKRMNNHEYEGDPLFSDITDDNVRLYDLGKNSSKEYLEELMQSIGYVSERRFENDLVVFKDKKSRLVNVENGIRKTCYQPEKYVGTIYFFGGCTVWGRLVEDQYTIPSLIQKKIIKKNKNYRVINLGNDSLINADNLSQSLSIGKNDLFISLFPFITESVKKKIDIIEMSGRFNELRKNKYHECECFFDMPQHCGTNGMFIYSEIIFEELEEYLNDTSEKKKQKNNINRIFKKNYKDLDVLYRYSDYIAELKNMQIKYGIKQDDKIGSIVMNSNPFTKGHRHLVEYAADNLDYLYVFVVEEDRSFFSFKDRYEMVKRGTEDLKNVIVVRSGNMIATSTTFPAYYRRKEFQISREKPAVGMDLRVFAQYIAPEINIKYRFVGEEPYDFVTKEYNKKMKEILPEFGIDVIEIPRKCMDGEIISASVVRKYYIRNDFENLSRWVPKTTAEYLMNKMDFAKANETPSKN